MGGLPVCLFAHVFLSVSLHQLFSQSVCSVCLSVRHLNQSHDRAQHISRRKNGSRDCVKADPTPNHRGPYSKEPACGTSLGGPPSKVTCLCRILDNLRIKCFGISNLVLGEIGQVLGSTLAKIGFEKTHGTSSSTMKQALSFKHTGHIAA